MEKAYKIRIEDGNILEISEIPGRDGISINVGGIFTFTLTPKQWKQLCDLKYSLECNPEPPEVE